MKLKSLPTQARLKAILDYNLLTGIFCWKHREDVHPVWNRRCAGKVAGTKDKKGIVIFVDNAPYRAHRLAWIYVHGDALKADALIDHKDCDPYNNKIGNLRLAKHGQNGSNSRQRAAKSLPKGVSEQVRGGRFRARIGIDGRVVYLGTFATPDLAHAAYCEAAVKAKGEFARFG